MEMFIYRGRLDTAVYLLVNQSPLSLHCIPRESLVVAFNLWLLFGQLPAPLPARIWGSSDKLSPGGGKSLGQAAAAKYVLKEGYEEVK